MEIEIADIDYYKSGSFLVKDSDFNGENALEIRLFISIKNQISAQEFSFWAITPNSASYYLSIKEKDRPVHLLDSMKKEYIYEYAKGIIEKCSKTDSIIECFLNLMLYFEYEDEDGFIKSLKAKRGTVFDDYTPY